LHIFILTGFEGMDFKIVLMDFKCRDLHVRLPGDAVSILRGVWLSWN
jgi:hypothetical protein